MTKGLLDETCAAAAGVLAAANVMQGKVERMVLPLSCHRRKRRSGRMNC